MRGLRPPPTHPPSPFPISPVAPGACAALIQALPRGEEYTEDSIGERLAVRDFMDGLRGAGVETGGARPYGARDKQAFAAALDRVLTRAMRGR